MTSTVHPRSSSASERCEPMNPAPPVINSLAMSLRMQRTSESLPACFQWIAMNKESAWRTGSSCASTTELRPFAYNALKVTTLRAAARPRE